jgi:soluble lytic murein transglycosylase
VNEIRSCKYIILSILFLFSCFKGTIEGNNLSRLGFYSTPQEIIKELKGREGGYREHFMLGLAYKEIKDYKKSIFHFANSCFKYKRSKKIRLFPHPVYSFIKGYHFKSELFDDAVYQIADLFYLYREYEYVVKFIELLDHQGTALYRDARLLKAKTLMELKKYESAIASLKDVLKRYEDAGSRSIVHIRIASVYERMENYNDALGQYMEVIKLSTKSWQSSVSLDRMLEIIPQSEFKPGAEDRLLIAEALYHNSKYEDALLYLEALLREELPPDKKISVHTYLIKNYVRTNKINKADLIIGLYADASDLYRRVSRVKADELWSMRRRNDAIAVYQALAGKDRDEIFKHALKRIGIHSERRKSYNFEGQLERYIELYPDDDTTEFFLWLLAKNQLRSNSFTSSKKFLESAVSRFPNGRYSDKVRFWLYKIYIQEQRFDDAEKMFKELIVQNPESSYTWTLLDRVIKKYDLKKIQSDFNSSMDKSDKNEALFYHTLLYVLEGDISKRDVRLKKIFSRWEGEYERFVDIVDGFDLGSKYKDRLKGIERYFAIGYEDAIRNELDILPNEEEIIRDEALTLSCFGEKYENYYLTTLYTLQLLKHYNLRENILLLSTKTIKRLFPHAFKECVQKNCDKYKIDRELVYSVIKAESLFNHKAVSPAGAVGLMQLMPRTARGLARELKIKRYDLFEPCISIAFGVKYLSWLNNLFKGDFEDIIGGYNAGAGNIIKWKNTLKYNDPDLFTELVPFEETRFYILRTRKFLFQYRLFSE